MAATVVLVIAEDIEVFVVAVEVGKIVVVVELVGVAEAARTLNTN